jgi:hypothetical protein
MPTSKNDIGLILGNTETTDQKLDYQTLLLIVASIS